MSIDVGRFIYTMKPKAEVSNTRRGRTQSEERKTGSAIHISEESIVVFKIPNASKSPRIKQVTKQESTTLIGSHTAWDYQSDRAR
jgi:hypothetical protein